jgi:glycogen operon protein
MDPGSWTDPNAKVVGLLLSDLSTRLLILVNAYHEPIPFTLPGSETASGWQVRIDTAAGAIDPADRGFAPAGSVQLEGRSLLFLVGAPP